MRKIIEVNTYRPVRVKGSGVGKIIGNLYKQTAQFIGIGFGIVERVLKGFPFFFVLINELRFAHTLAKVCNLKVLFSWRKNAKEKAIAVLKSFYDKTKTEAGCDEAGRGCLAGPVFAAAVILPKRFKNELLNDSKKLSKQQRDLLRLEIESKALAWSVAFCMQNEIDEINILNASILAMHKAVSNLKVQPEFLLIDGNRFKTFNNIPHKCFIKGDGIYASIAAASILAKTNRDEYMLNLHNHFPQYKWNKNKAYATAEHIEAIKTFGYCEHHRKSFHLKPKQLALEM